MQLHALPEICSTDLVQTTLLLSEWGCSSMNEILQEMPFVDLPPENALQKAYDMLVDLEALEEYQTAQSKQLRYRITDHGCHIVRLGTHPRFSTCMVRAEESRDSATLAAAVTVAALLDEEMGGGGDSNLAVRVRDILQSGDRSIQGRNVVQQIRSGVRYF